MTLQIYHVKIDVTISSKQTMKQHLKSYLRREKDILCNNKNIAKNRIRSTRYTKQRLEEAKDNLNSIYQQTSRNLMYEVTNRKSSPLSKIKGVSETERIQSWYNHFKNLLGKQNPEAPDLSSTFFNYWASDPFLNNTSQFMFEELLTCLAKISKQKHLAQIIYQPCYGRIITFTLNCFTSAMKHQKEINHQPSQNQI